MTNYNHRNTLSLTRPEYPAFPCALPIASVVIFPSPGETVDEKLETFVTDRHQDSRQRALLTVVGIASLAKSRHGLITALDYIGRTSEPLERAMAAATNLKAILRKNLLLGKMEVREEYAYRDHMEAINNIVAVIAPESAPLSAMDVEARILIPSAFEVSVAFEKTLFHMTWDSEAQMVKIHNGYSLDIMTVAQDNNTVLASVDALMYLTSHGFGIHAHTTGFNGCTAEEMLSYYQLALAIVKTRVASNLYKDGPRKKHLLPMNTAIVRQLQDKEPQKPITLPQLILLIGGYLQKEA